MAHRAVIVFSARTDSADKVEALDAGADDYVTKPFGVDEFLARLRAAVRCGTAASDSDEPVIETSSSTVDLAAKKVTKNGSDVGGAAILYGFKSAKRDRAPEGMSKMPIR
jgi:two-component system KDP operon response regulator KdpE